MELADRVAEIARRARDLDDARRRLDLVLRTAIGYDVGSLSTVDPATGLWTSCYVSGLDADGSHERERTLFALDLGGDVNAFAALASGGRGVATLRRSTGGDVTRARRWAPLLAGLDVVDELRAVLRVGGETWGTLALYRTGTAEPFGRRDALLVADAAPTIATLLRLMLLRLALARPAAVDAPPGAFTVDRNGAVSAVSTAARAWLAALDDRGRIPAVVQSVAAAARSRGLAVAAVPSRLGGIVTLHGSPVGDGGDVAVVIEAARPAVVSSVIAAAYALTTRERDVTGLAAQGRSTREIARDLHISPFTVADHLKAAFGKVGVSSRAELVATLYHQHYARAAAEGLAPSPYGWYLDHNVAGAN